MLLSLISLSTSHGQFHSSECVIRQLQHQAMTEFSQRSIAGRNSCPRTNFRDVEEAFGPLVSGKTGGGGGGGSQNRVAVVKSMFSHYLFTLL